MHDIRFGWAWIISRFALARLIALTARGTPPGDFAFQGAYDAVRPRPWYAHLLRVSAEGDLVLVMDPSVTSKSLSLLLSDDQTLMGDALAHVLKTAGYVVERVSDGEAAYDRLSGAPDQYDALIADHAQPRLDGINLVKSLRHAGFSGRILIYGAALLPSELEVYHALEAEPIVLDQSDAARLLAIMKTLHREK